MVISFGFSLHYEAKLCFLRKVRGFRNKDVHFFFFCSLTSFDCYNTNLQCLKTCLSNPETYRHEIVRLSSAQFGLVMYILHF